MKNCSSMTKHYSTREEMVKDLISKDSTIAEIGVFTGEFTQYMLDTLKPKQLYGIEPYISTIGVMGSGDVNGHNMEFYELELLNGFVKNRFLVHTNVSICREKSEDFFNRIPDGHLDAVYIDGDHSLEAVKNDLEAARYAVKEGGWIMGHDYALNSEKGNSEIKHFTKEAIDAFCSKYNLEINAFADDGIVSFAIRNINKYKISIVSYSDREALYSETFMRFKVYSQMHNYKCTVHTTLPPTDRHPSWNKIPVLRNEILSEKSNLDFVVWMDDDIYVTDMEKPLSYFIDLYGFRKSKANILVSSDIPGEISSHINCGIMFFKTTPDSMTILDSAWKLGDMNPLSKNGYSWEQDIFNFLYKFDCRHEFIVVPQPNFQTCARVVEINLHNSWKVGHFAAHLQYGNLQLKLQMLHLIKKLLLI